VIFSVLVHWNESETGRPYKTCMDFF
jgi:hypothetical protein